MITATCTCGTKIQYFRKIDRICGGYRSPRIHFFNNGTEITHCPKCKQKLYLALLKYQQCKVETHPKNEIDIDYFIKNHKIGNFITRSNWRKK